jgi:glycosyltransferase involved in cell wall biosynthesis
MAALSVLFVDQGRVSSSAAMGHVRVKHAIETGIAASNSAVSARHLEVRPFTRAERVATRYVRRLGAWNFGAIRWHLVRGWVARQAIRSALDAAPADVVHLVTDQISFLLGDVQRRVPCVLSLDVLTTDWARLRNLMPMEQALPPHLRPLEVLERRALMSAPLSIAWTETVAERLRLLAPTAKATTLHPGLDLQTFRPDRSLRKGGRRRVLFVGGRWEEKGGPELVAALAGELGRTVELDVVTTETIAPTEGVRVHSARPGSNEVRELFARADVFCLPTSIDAAPWAVLEAMACGVPVVSARLASIPEMVGAGGVTVPPRDPEALRSALHEVLENPQRRAAMGEAGRARVEETYDARRNIPRLLDLLHHAAGSR